MLRPMLSIAAAATLVSACAGPAALGSPSVDDLAWCSAHMGTVYRQFMIDLYGADVVYVVDDETPMYRQLATYYGDAEHLAADLPDTTPARADAACVKARQTADSAD